MATDQPWDSQQQEKNIQDEPSLLRVREDGSCIAVCGMACATKIVRYSNSDHLTPSLMNLSEMRTAPPECIHCSWCRVVLALPEPAACRFHGEEECPLLLPEWMTHPQSQWRDHS